MMMCTVMCDDVYCVYDDEVYDDVYCVCDDEVR